MFFFYLFFALKFLHIIIGFDANEFRNADKQNNYELKKKLLSSC
jgi:hypothetical protein